MWVDYRGSLSKPARIAQKIPTQGSPSNAPRPAVLINTHYCGWLDNDPSHISQRTTQTKDLKKQCTSVILVPLMHTAETQTPKL